MKIIPISLALLFFFSCNHSSIQYVARVKLNPLSKSEIYDFDAVENRVFDSEELDTDSLRRISRRLFLNGLDAFRNKKDISSAISLFKQSIVVLPDAKTYYELGNALLEGGHFERDFNEALDAYGIAKSLNFSPLYQIHYKSACAAAHLDQASSDIVYSHLTKAFACGFRDTVSMLKNLHLHRFVNSSEYKDFLTQLIMDNMKQKNENLFSVFKKGFPKLSSDFEITPTNVEMKTYKLSISYDFAKFIPEMQTSSFGRNVSNEFVYVGLVSENEHYTAVLYNSVSYMEEEMQPIYTILATYDPDGKIISTIVFSGQFTAEKIKCGRVDQNKLYIEDLKRVWEFPIYQVPIEQNRVMRHETIAKATYQIEADGKIIELSVPENFNDSLPIAKN